MKTYTIGTSWKRLLAVSALLSAVMTGYPGATLAGCGSNYIAGGLHVGCNWQQMQRLLPKKQQRHAQRMQTRFQHRGGSYLSEG